MRFNIPQRGLHRLHVTLLAAEKRWRWLLGFFVLVLLSVTIRLDSVRPFWNDELFTYYISRQPSLHVVLSALKTGAEQLPIFFFVITRLFTSSPTAGRVSFRLPETLGFLVMCVCAFFFVRRRSPAAYGFIALLLPAVTDAYSFAYEARPYGLVMGFSGLAMLCWQRAAEQQKRMWALIGMTIFLASATNTHYYAVLLLFPFGLAELVRFEKTRKLDIPMYLALFLSLAPLVLSISLIRAASKFSSHFWSKPLWTALISFYELLFMPAGFALLLMILISGAYLFLRSSSNETRASDSLLVAHEVALAVGFALLPVVAIVLAKFVTGAFTLRYAIYSVLGLSILVAWSLARIGQSSIAFGLAVSAVTLGCWLVITVRLYGRFTSTAHEETTTFRFLMSHDRGLPIVITSPHQFFVQAHRAAQESQGKLFYLADVPLALQYSGTDTVERGLLALKDYAPLHVEDYHSFVSTHPSFLLYGQPGAFGWTLQESVRTGKTLSVVANNGEDPLYLVGAGKAVQDR